ncbi:ATP synthase F1 subunit epsilon [Ureaplasma parvum]|jgi:ATP synthase F1, epsilon subunit|uniref:ATP synthase epsilon chain n=3 Tax=Ureaplasma parvum TaxID=134821 RepID=ATPE_UREPA|nr:ATP synthase F1 subunit epsilon [Ureaplasma parvum]B1AIB7.1 RecName: Full=ATP synthase epsilon chain; AltName: Full=ATP synthase F1 sector epsilon subunit; AltName: Full=F-ATPase epsilon subunit [Ureaplasma parvum serovar 3 str. ATCC 27815]Q9PR16.1 RecName: Full=ATP synthase epsilon chain; AltName: Full=ATP synthase F1 sector epsilon subunit; AltName: Full=F-ATPase epsilon subunit [Ureaplasma parvum serovar 3 str. ATCC 700970]pir/G82928/ ATP synthase epsilon chain UU128 [imported] - Ureaplasm
MANLTKLKIVTPYAQILEKDVYSVELKTSEGRITVLPDHNPLMSTIENHVAYIRELPNTPRKPLLLLDGIVYIEQHQVRVFSDYFKFLDEIQIDEINSSLNQLKHDLNNEEDDKKKLQLKSKIKLNESILIAYKDR